MTEEQKHAQAELEKTLDTLSEDELDALAGGKVTDDVKKFFQSEKGKEVLKWTAIAGGTAVTLGTAAGIIGGIIYKKTRPWKKNSGVYVNEDRSHDTGYAPENDSENFFGGNYSGGD